LVVVVLRVGELGGAEEFCVVIRSILVVSRLVDGGSPLRE
jgi:hypothetical protein